MMTVNQLSKRGSVAPHVIRYYSRIGLLNPARHPENGYKLFKHSDVTRLRFIRQAQSLGFTLEEIAKIFEDSTHGTSPCERVRDILTHRIDENRRKLEELVRLQERMENALEQWQTMPDGLPDGHSVCHLIESTGVVRHDA